jgi:hypothetical protein
VRRGRQHATCRNYTSRARIEFLIVLGTVVVVLLFFYMGISDYSISEDFIGRSLIISRYLLADLRGIRLAVSYQH